MSRLSDLRFLAACFDLADPNERKRSAGELTSLYLDLVTAINPDVTVEIGAFDASFSQAIKQRLPQVRAVAFEANPYNFEEVASRVAAAGIEYVHKAVSDVDGTVTFNIMAAYGDDRFRSGSKATTRSFKGRLRAWLTNRSPSHRSPLTPSLDRPNSPDADRAYGSTWKAPHRRCSRAPRMCSREHKAFSSRSRTIRIGKGSGFPKTWTRP